MGKFVDKIFQKWEKVQSNLFIFFSRKYDRMIEEKILIKGKF